MSQPYKAPAELLNTIKQIIKNPNKPLKDLGTVHFVPVKLDQNKPAPKYYLNELIALLKKFAPALYEKNKILLTKPIKASRTGRKTVTRLSSHDFKSYDKVFPKDLEFIKSGLSYIHNLGGSRDVHLAPIQAAFNFISLLPNADYCLGYLTAQQLMGMIQYKYQLKAIKSLKGRIHFEHGLSTSVMPDQMLGYALKLNKARKGTVEALKHHFSALLSEALKEKAFTKQQLVEWFKIDKDLSRSKIKAILDI